tara:strand:- start:1849 stop:1995 length:147 start_codon:yes stop_codon:yes gene_type:complete
MKSKDIDKKLSDFVSEIAEHPYSSELITLMQEQVVADLSKAVSYKTAI